MSLKLSVYQDKTKQYLTNNRKVWFGKYTGYEVKNIPTEYMKWFIEQYPDQKRMNLRKFQRRAWSLFKTELDRRNAQIIKTPTCPSPCLEEEDKWD